MSTVDTDTVLCVTRLRRAVVRPADRADIPEECRAERDPVYRECHHAAASALLYCCISRLSGASGGGGRFCLHSADCSTVDESSRVEAKKLETMSPSLAHRVSLLLVYRRLSTLLYCTDSPFKCASVAL